MCFGKITKRFLELAKANGKATGGMSLPLKFKMQHRLRYFHMLPGVSVSGPVETLAKCSNEC